jgi:hypothetical protein
MYRIFGVVCPVIIAGLLFTTRVEANTIRKYRLPDHGMLVLSVPESWTEEVRQPPFGLPPTIILRPAEKDNFVIMITPLWNPNGDEAFNSNDAIRELMEQEAQAMKTRALEKELALIPIKGSAAHGYYYAATDKAPKPEEWEYMLRAGVACGELLISGTFLTHEKSSSVVSETLQVFQSAKQTNEETLRSAGSFDFRYPPILPHDDEYGLPTHEQKMWALATHALITETNRTRHDLLGGCERTLEEIQNRRKNLAEWWGIRNREDLIRTLRWIEEGGHRKDFDEMRQYIKALPFDERKAFLKQLEAEPEMNNKYHVISYYRAIYGDKSIVAWDFARYTVLCGWGYVAGYFTEEEAWRRMMPAAKLLQQTFDSWEDLGKNYTIGREFWSLAETRRNGEAMAKASWRLRTLPDSPWKTIPWDLDLTPREATQVKAEKAP